MELAEKRNRELVANKDGDAKAREDALLAALQRVKTAVEELGVRAEGMEQQQLRHTKDLAARHAEVTKALNTAARHTVTIADAHRRDIDRVERDRECATVLAELVERTAELALEERLRTDSSNAVRKVVLCIACCPPLAVRAARVDAGRTLRGVVRLRFVSRVCGRGTGSGRLLAEGSLRETSSRSRRKW